MQNSLPAIALLGLLIGGNSLAKIPTFVLPTGDTSTAATAQPVKQTTTDIKPTAVVPDYHSENIKVLKALRDDINQTRIETINSLQAMVTNIAAIDADMRRTQHSHQAVERQPAPPAEVKVEPTIPAYRQRSDYATLIEMRSNCAQPRSTSFSAPIVTEVVETYSLGSPMTFLSSPPVYSPPVYSYAAPPFFNPLGFQASVGFGNT